MTNLSTVLGEIRRCIKQAGQLNAQPPSWKRTLDLNKLHEHERELQRAALQSFAERNGWKVTSNGFSAKEIGRRYRDDYYNYRPNAIFDHTAYFSRGRVNAAIVTQPYRFAKTVADCIREAKIYAEHLDLDFHIPPRPFASIWYPGSTLFFVFTEPEHSIIWLPEQESGVAFSDKEAA